MYPMIELVNIADKFGMPTWTVLLQGEDVRKSYGYPLLSYWAAVHMFDHVSNLYQGEDE